MKEGIYFGLGESDYHAVPALSNSGVKNLLISPTDFWARASWLNPNFESEESVFMELGKAYHKRILEGKERFYALYAAELDPADYPNALRTMEEIREAAKEQRDIKLGGKKADLIERLLAEAPETEIWDALVEANAKAHEGKTLLPADAIARLEISAAMIESHPDLCKAFTGGQPEVSIFWTDAEYGVPMKCRPDYLKTRAIVDLKTFGNAQRKPIDRAVTYEMASRKYHVQTAFYLEGVEIAKQFIRDGKVFGEVDKEWLEALAKTPNHDFLFVFQQTGGLAPVARGYRLPRNLTYDCGKIIVNQAKFTYAECVKKFGTDMWIDGSEIRDFDDSEMPVWMND